MSQNCRKPSSCGSRGSTKLQNEPYRHNLNDVKRKKKEKKVKLGRFNCIYPQVGCKRCHRDRYESAEPSAQEKCFSWETSVILTRTRWASQLAAVCMLFIKQQQRPPPPASPSALHLFSCLSWPDTLKFKWVFFSSFSCANACVPSHFPGSFSVNIREQPCVGSAGWFIHTAVILRPPSLWSVNYTSIGMWHLWTEEAETVKRRAATNAT